MGVVAETVQAASIPEMATGNRSRVAGASERVPELDGLRGLAILLVILCHYISNSRGGTSLPFAYFSRMFSLGWSGVDLFFVLSGFLIGGILLDARAAPNYFRAFYVRRVHRILPVYYVWISLFALTSFLLLRFSPEVVEATHLQSPMPVAYYYLFFQNLVSATYVGLAWYWISITWSLAVEEQFYLITPPLIRFLSPRRLTSVLIAVVVLAPVVRYFAVTSWPGGREAAYILLPCRADSLALGILATVAWRTPRVKQWLAAHLRLLRFALLALFSGLLVLLKWYPTPYHLLTQTLGFSWLAWFYACLMLLALLATESWAARLFRFRPLRELGTVSYCVYLIHFLVLAACHRLILGSAPSYGDLPGAGVTLLAFTLTIGIAKLSWKYFEQPLLRRGQACSYWPARQAADVGLVAPKAAT